MLLTRQSHVTIVASDMFLTRQSHLTSCQICNIFVGKSKVKERYGNIDKHFNFDYFEMIHQLKHILQGSF